jgi:hypothetical protein
VLENLSGYYTGLSFFLWFISIEILFLSFLLFIREALKMDLTSQRMANYGYGVYSGLMGVTRIMFIVAVYNPDLYDFYTILGYMSGIIGLIFWLYIVETYLIRKTKKIFTIISIIPFSFSFLALFGLIDRDIALDIQFLLLPLAVLVILILYIYLIKKTTGTVRKKFIGILTGLVLMIVSQVMDGEDFITALPDFPLFVAPLLNIMGAIIFLVTQLYFFKPTEDEFAIDKSTVSLIEGLGIDFTKPEDLTEKEVAFYRERIICLVCKTQIEGFQHIFVCIKCKALYCENCAQALSELENTCWSCDVPIDKSKPVKVFKKDKKKVEAQILEEGLKKAH